MEVQENNQEVGRISDRQYRMDKNFDFRYMKATDLPFNKRVYLPGPLEQDVEIQLQALKSKLEETTRAYIEEANKKNEKSNLSLSQKKGLKKILKRKTDKEIVVFQTDKTNSFSVDTVDNYKIAGQCHSEKDEVITEKEKDQLENNMNAHAAMWIRFLNAGEKRKQQERIERNMLQENSDVAPMYVLRKDHKKLGIDYDDDEKGPPTRPICGAETCYNSKMSYLLSNLLYPLVEECETNCNSTEEMLASIGEVNKRCIDEEVVIGSADVKALYPSLDITFTIQIVVETFLNSGIEIEGINYKELSLYLALNRSEEELQKLNLSQYCPKRRSNRGRRPTITASGTETKAEKRYAPWIFPEDEPDETTKRKMVGEALRIGLMMVMKNHIYTFDSEVRKQRKGGAIGLQLTGVMAEIFMGWWDKQILLKLEQVNIIIELYKRYVDDINSALKGDIRGKRYINGELVYSEEKMKEDQDKEQDALMMELVRTIGNDIHQSIQLEVDYPSRYEDEKLPILDLKVWLGRRRKDEKRVIMYEYYEKEINSKWMIHAEAALAMQSKRTILTQQLLRVLLNCSEDLPWEHKAEKANKMMMKVQYSGYGQEFRHDIVKSAIKAYNKIVEEEEDGIRPMFRP